MPEDDVLPGPIKLHSKAATGLQARDGREVSGRTAGIAALSAYALAASEENGRGHLVITGADGRFRRRHAGAGLRTLEGGRNLPLEKIRDGMLAAAAVGYLCKHHATLSAAEGGCQAEIGVASSMAAALTATAYDAESLVVENAAESALEHHLGMTCDPVAGYVQVPCIERCAFGAVKAWDRLRDREQRDRVQAPRQFRRNRDGPGPDRQRHEQQVQGTSEAGLALSVTLC
jgi:L-serine dehydratase